MKDRHRSGITVAIIGAGSTYTPMIVQELSERQEVLPVEELRLFDVDESRLAVVSGFCRRLVDRRVKIRRSRSLGAAVDGADFVVSQIRVGQLAARHQDILLGRRHGLIGQETTGVGGLAKALRTILPTLKICRAMRHRAADGAWLINFTNPSSIITEAVLKHGGVRCVGLCNGPLGMAEQIAADLGVEASKVRLDYVGANHLGWVRGVRVAGRDATAAAGRKFRENWRAPHLLAQQSSPVFEKAIGLPYSAYLHYYYYTGAMFDTIHSKKRTRAQEALAIERVLLRKYADPRTGGIPQELSKRGGSGYNLVAADVMESIANDRGDLRIVNVANGGAVAGIEPDACVEITARVSRDSIRPVRFGRLEPQFRGLLQVVKAYEELAVKAGVEGDPAAALHALVLHPLGPTAETATAVLRDLLDTHSRYLPQFTAARLRRFFET